MSDTHEHDELDQARVQLAGCSVAALGGKDMPEKGGYGWSASLQDVLELRAKYETAEACEKELEARVDELEIENKKLKLARCPFDGPIAIDPEDPCPVCGGLGTDDAEDKCIDRRRTEEEIIARQALSGSSELAQLERAVVDAAMADYECGFTKLGNASLGLFKACDNLSVRRGTCHG